MSTKRNIRKKALSDSDDDVVYIKTTNSLNQSHGVSSLSFMDDVPLSFTPSSMTKNELPKSRVFLDLKKPDNNQNHKFISPAQQSKEIPDSMEIFDARKSRLNARETEKPDNYDSSEDNVELEESEDDWEEQQIRKGVNSVVVKQTEEKVDDQQVIIPTWVGTGDEILDSMKEKLKEVNTRTSSDDRKGIRTRMTEAFDRLDALKQKRPNLESSYQFYQSIRDYILTLGDCINEKMLGIEHVLTKSLTNFKEKKMNEQFVVEARALFEDTADEYCNVNEICRKFSEWKTFCRDSYENSYGGLSLCKMVTPFVRLELINWNPLSDFCRKVEDFGWFKTLTMYSLNTSEEFDERDCHVVPIVVEKAVVSRLADIVSETWDPTCYETTLRFVEIVKHLFSMYPIPIPDSKEAQKLFGIIKAKVDESLKLSIPLYSKEVLQKRQSREAVYFYESLWRAIRLFESLGCFSQIVSTCVIERWSWALVNDCILVVLKRVEVNKEVLEMCWELLCTMKRMSLRNDVICPFADYCCNLMILVDSGKYEELRDNCYKFIDGLKDIGAIDQSNMLTDIITIH